MVEIYRKFVLKMILKLIFAVIFFELVLCNRESDMLCVKKGLDSIHKEAKGMDNVQDDKVLLDLAQHNLKIGIDLIHKRALATKLDCYYDFTKKYWSGLKQISDELNSRLSKASTQTERSEAVSSIATMSQVMKCDEEDRARHSNETNECSKLEELGGVESKFNSLYTILKGRMFWGNIWERNKNKIIEGIINYDLQMYSRMYGEAKNCVARQRKIDKCTNYKILVEEMERFFSLFDLIDIN